MRWQVLVVVLLAAGVRLLAIHEVDVTQWDAGTYTAGALEVGPYGRQPILLYYAPPLLPAVNAALFAVFGERIVAAMVFMALVGAATVWATWAFGRKIVGDRAALIGAAALAGMEYHVVYSRQPLTDGLYTLLFVLSAWALWERRGLLAGLGCGLGLLTKYHGFFPLVLFGGWILLKREKGWRPLFVAGAVTAGFGSWLLWHIHDQVGIEAFRANRSQWLPELAPYVLRQTATFYARALFEWVSPVVLLAALVGLFRKRSAFLLLWIALFVITLPLYINYPRLLVPTLPALALLAGLATERFGPLAAIVLAGAGLFAIDQQEGQGYSTTAAWLVEQGKDAEGRPDLLVTQHAILWGLRDATNPFLTYDEEGAVQARASGDFRYVIADMRERLAPGFTEGLVEIDVVPNPIPEPFLVNTDGFDGLDEVRAQVPDARRMTTIRVYSATGS